MHPSRIVVAALALMIAGCSQTPPMTDPLQKPDPAPEMQKLARMVGTWTGVAEMVSPSPEEMKAMMPEGAEELPGSYEGGHTGEWVMDGMFLKNEGWHEMGGGEKATFVEYIGWDPKQKKYRSWYISNWGERGEGWTTLSDDGNTLHVKVKSTDAEGKSKSGAGTWTFVDDNNAEWTWSEKGPMGKMKMKGTTSRTQ